jgi:glycosyltransferase involved in cell wall biosynthesis
MSGRAQGSVPRLLVLCDRFPTDLASGRYLRMHYLCRQLTRRFDCFLVDFGRGQSDQAAAAETLGCVDHRSLPDHQGEDRSTLRHLRLSNGRLIQRLWPAYRREMLGVLRGLVQEWRIDGVVCLSRFHGEFGIELGLPRVVDACDCQTLTLRRVLASRGHAMPWAERQLTRIKMLRAAGGERFLLRHYDCSFTIAEPERVEYLRLSGVAPERIRIVPNGVAPAAIELGATRREPTRSVVFWGNLDFPPNWTAVEHFYEQMFLPRLAPAGVAWSIYGRGAGPRIEEIARHPLIQLEGYCPDLFEAVKNCGVMINPMVEGSGLKNKVLEAFALGLPVVSTRRGIEAMPVRDGSECRVEDEPDAFAAAVMDLLEQPAQAAAIAQAARELVAERFTWDVVGDELLDIVDEVLDRRGRPEIPRQAS